MTAIKVKDISQQSCERCKKNYKEYGQPKKCQICELQSAFIGKKCQRCSSALKKFGKPQKCSKCQLRSAFDNAKARIDGKLLCWLCCMNYHREMKAKGVAVAGGVTISNADDDADDVIFEETIVYEDGDEAEQDDGNSSGIISLDDRLRNMAESFQFDKKFDRKNSPPKHKPIQNHHNSSHPHKKRKIKGEERPTIKSNNSSTVATTNEAANNSNIMDRLNKLPDNNSTIGFDSQIVVITELREKKTQLEKVIVKKDQQLLEKDKHISTLTAEHLRQIRSLQEKLVSTENDYLKIVDQFRTKNQELLRKIAQLSKGKV